MQEPGDGVPIKVAARQSGVSPDLIRAWERRYGAIAPARAAGRVRSYAPAEIARLVRLRRAVEAGHRIGSLAHRTDAELDALVLRAAPAPAPTGQLERLLEQVVRLDHVAAGHELSQAALLLPLPRLVTELLLPLIRITGARWHAGELGIAHEHLVTMLIRGLLETLLRSRPQATGRPVLVTTLSGERHELGALIAALMLAGQGRNTCYLGPDLPVPEIGRAATTMQAAGVVISVIQELEPAATRSQLAELAASLPSTTWLLVGGRSHEGLPARARYCADLTELEGLINA